jgi:SSS family solute:Na+ symporter
VKPSKSPQHYVRVGRIGVVVFGVLLGAFAIRCFLWQQADRDYQKSSELLNFALGVMGFAYAGLVAVFLTALLTKRGNALSVIASILTGFVLIYLLQPTTWSEEILASSNAFIQCLSYVLEMHFTWRLCIATSICFLIAAAPCGKRDEL